MLFYLYFALHTIHCFPFYIFFYLVGCLSSFMLVTLIWCYALVTCQRAGLWDGERMTVVDDKNFNCDVSVVITWPSLVQSTPLLKTRIRLK